MNNYQIAHKVKKKDIFLYRSLFDAFPYFENYINFAFDHLEPEIWVDSIENPNAAYFYTTPVYFLTGDPSKTDILTLFSAMPDYSWIVASNTDWSHRLKSYFKGKLNTHKRTLFDSKYLDPAHVSEQISKHPEGLNITKIGPDQVQQNTGLFYKDILKRYFTDSDFLKTGLGYCAMDGDLLVGFAAANFPIRQNVLEIYVRVLDDPKYLRKGLGTTLSATLINDCLTQDIEPVWDAANEISAHMAIKLGYKILREWEMYQIRL